MENDDLFTNLTYIISELNEARTTCQLEFIPVDNYA